MRLVSRFQRSSAADLGHAGEVAEGLPRLLRPGEGDEQGPAVGGAVDAVHARQVGVVLAVAHEGVARQRGLLDLPGLQPDLRAVGGGVDLLRDAVPLAGEESRHDAQRQLHRAGHVGDDGARQHGRAVARAGHVDQAAAGEAGAVDHALVGLGPEVAEAVDGGVDQVGLDRAEGVVAVAHALEGGLAVVGEEDVGAGDELVDDLAALLGVEVDADRALALVGVDELRAQGALGRVVVGAAVVTGAVALGRLDAGHLRAHVAQVAARRRPLQSARHLYHLDAGQCLDHEPSFPTPSARPAHHAPRARRVRAAAHGGPSGVSQPHATDGRRPPPARRAAPCPGR